VQLGFYTGLDQSISLQIFLTSLSNLHVLGVPMGSLSLVKSFVSKGFHEDLNMFVSFPMFADP
jgi:hypothetical protein